MTALDVFVTFSNSILLPPRHCQVCIVPFLTLEYNDFDESWYGSNSTPGVYVRVYLYISMDILCGHIKEVVKYYLVDCKWMIFFFILFFSCVHKGLWYHLLPRVLQYIEIIIHFVSD